MSRHPSTSDAEPVAWIGGPRGRDEESEFVRDAIVNRGVASYGALVVFLAERLFARDRACSGAAADIGFFRSWYLIPARRVVARLEGSDVEIGAAVPPRSVGHA